MRFRWWREKPGKDEEIQLAKERVEETAEIIARERERAGPVVDFLHQELRVNHLAERVRWALKEDPTK